MDSSKNRRRIIPFKKLGRLRVKKSNERKMAQTLISVKTVLQA